MASAPLTIKLRVTSWKQLAGIYKRDLTRSAIFLKSKKPPPLGTKVRINLTLPSDTLIVLAGIIHRHIPAAGLGGRGPGVDVKLNHIPQSAMWLIESALASAKGEDAKSASVPTSTTVAERQRRAPPTHQEKPADETALEDGEEIVEAEEELVDALKHELESLRKLNPFQVLNIKYDTNDEQVRAAFGGLTKKYHPDRFARFQSKDARMYASEIFILIRDAYRRLGNAGTRSTVLNELRAEAQQRRAHAQANTPAPQRTPAPPRTPVPGRTPSPALANMIGSESTPVPGTSRPVDIDRDKPGKPGNYSSADALLEAGKYDEALAIYSLAQRKSPNDPAIRAGIELAEGLKALAQRDRLEAAQRFESVLELEPTNERAARELADMRRQATTDRKGLLSRLLGKKV